MITGQPTSLLLILPGQSFTFTVVATGDSLVYRWQKDGADISGANSATYTIEAVAESDEGQYWCVVSNAAGNSTSATANLTVCKCLQILNITSLPLYIKYRIYSIKRCPQIKVTFK